MVAIRVRPDILHNQANNLEQIANEVRRIGDDMRRAAANQPSYDGQFGPRVSGIGNEAIVRSQRLSSQLSGRHGDLNQRASRFEAVDAASISTYPIIYRNGVLDQVPYWRRNDILDRQKSDIWRCSRLGRLTFGYNGSTVPSSGFPEWGKIGIDWIKKGGDFAKAVSDISTIGITDYYKNAITISRSEWYQQALFWKESATTLINADKYVNRLIASTNSLSRGNLLTTGVSLAAAWTQDFYKYKEKGIAHLGAAFAVDAGLEAVNVAAAMGGMKLGAVIGAPLGPGGVAVGAIIGGVLAGWAADYVTHTSVGDMIVDISKTAASSLIPIVGSSIGQWAGEKIVTNLLSPELAKTSLKDAAIEGGAHLINLGADGINAAADLVRKSLFNDFQTIQRPQIQVIDSIIEPTIQMVYA